jgi:DsbC/DsbD-like thiol-disulfide interchange protein
MAKYLLPISLAAALMLVACHRESPDSASDRSTPKATLNSPVSAWLKCDKNQVHLGEIFTVELGARITPGWHIYAMDRSTGSSLPTSIGLNLPAGLERSSEWAAPEPSLDEVVLGQPSFIYTGNVTFRCQLQVAHDSHTGSLTIRGELKYQACDRFNCHPPDSINLETNVQVIP